MHVHRPWVQPINMTTVITEHRPTYPRRVSLIRHNAFPYVSGVNWTTLDRPVRKRANLEMAT